MNKAISIAVLAVGVLLLVLGMNAYDSASSDISRFFTGSPTDKATWMLVGGVAVTAIGLVSLLRASKKASE